MRRSPEANRARPQARKVALDLPAGGPVVGYGVTIGHAVRDLPGRSWVARSRLLVSATSLRTCPYWSRRYERRRYVRSPSDAACSGDAAFSTLTSRVVVPSCE